MRSALKLLTRKIYTKLKQRYLEIPNNMETYHQHYENGATIIFFVFT